MMGNIKILVADDDEKILFAFKELFKKENFESVTAANGEEAMEKILSNHLDIIFLDITMPKFNGIEVLEFIKKRQLNIPVIMITGYGTMQTAIKAIQEGAFEYLTKPLDVKKIRDVIHQALASIRSRAVPNILPVYYNPDFSEHTDIIGISPQIMEVFKLIGSISTTPNYTSVLIAGESGTGKELVARAIHNNSAVASEPFIAINCAAFPETLLESELFGHEKGSFTGAIERKLGKFEIAKNGTIFLDEIGNLSLNLQQKLLRVIQNREFERVGGNTIIPILARFVAATNIDILPEIKKGNFREDLYYRLNVAHVQLAPLRDRKEDIPLLANYFLAKFNFHLKKSIIGFSDEALKLLTAYNYPGNIRELQNLIERAVMLAKTDVILSESLKDMMPDDSEVKEQIPIKSPIFSEAKAYILDSFEKKFVKALLTKFSGNVSSAARASGMTRQNFLRMMKKYEIRADYFRPKRPQDKNTLNV